MNCEGTIGYIGWTHYCSIDLRGVQNSHFNFRFHKKLGSTVGLALPIVLSATKITTGYASGKKVTVKTIGGLNPGYYTRVAYTIREYTEYCFISASLRQVAVSFDTYTFNFSRAFFFGIIGLLYWQANLGNL